LPTPPIPASDVPLKKLAKQAKGLGKLLET